ncbi:Alpha/Beta hydrolase protein [Leucosporidium creatinivorum]|uniref:Alpha/Beta hydrolase protein n=1 Tax=Leucosporidium creatinivorum TaxID=106004 RepID=A0A1Y2G2J4_9BASI|nr:Alpha/Beta hydrolase protein [Leucosporidium creatinivorum]
MPYVDVPLRGNLHLHYISNPRMDGGDLVSQPMDFTRHTIVFFHAGTSSSSSFRAQMEDPRLNAHYNLLFMDARFHGGTEGANRDSHKLEDSAECLIAALDTLGVPSYTIFAEGIQGCPCAVHCYLMRPQNVRGLILASPGWMTEDPEVKNSLRQMLGLICANKDGKGDGTGTIDTEVLRLVVEYFIGHAPRLDERREAAQVAVQQRYGTGHNSHDISHIILSGADRTPPSPAQLASITCPILILSGTDDKVVSPLAAAEEWKRALKGAKGGATIASITGAPHLMSLSDFVS